MLRAFADIHCHILYGVDDGADSIEESYDLLRSEAKQGVTHIVLTPHYRRGMFSYPTELIEEHYAALRDYAETQGISLYLGCEYHVDGDMAEHIESGRVHTLGDSEYVLSEYSDDTEYEYIMRTCGGLLRVGYVPVIAHAERYRVFRGKPDRLRDVRDMGCLVQINADSVLGIDGRAMKSATKAFLKKGYADIVASDCHGTRERMCNLGRAYEYIGRKYGEDAAQRLFVRRPGRIIDAIAGE